MCSCLPSKAQAPGSGIPRDSPGAEGSQPPVTVPAHSLQEQTVTLDAGGSRGSQSLGRPTALSTPRLWRNQRFCSASSCGKGVWS